MSNKKTGILFLMIIFSLTAFADPVESGKTLFTTRCAACHNVNKAILGPALSGVEDRHTIDWIVSFVHSSQTMIKNGNKDAVALFEKFNKVPMPDHTDLKEADIKDILSYIKSESKSSDATAKAPFAKPGKQRADHLPLSSGDWIFFTFFLGALFTLIRALVYVVQLKTYIREKKDERAIVLETDLTKDSIHRVAV